MKKLTLLMTCLCFSMAASAAKCENMMGLKLTTDLPAGHKCIKSCQCQDHACARLKKDTVSPQCTFSTLY